MRFHFLQNRNYYALKKMFYIDDITNENNKEYNNKWPYIRGHPYRILIIGRSG